MLPNGLTKEEFLEALHQEGIDSLEDWVDYLMPDETGGYAHSEENLKIGGRACTIKTPRGPIQINYTIPGMP